MKPVLGILAMSALLSVEVRATDPIRVGRWVFRLGDDPAWASPQGDDSAWQPFHGFDPSLAEAVYWLRGKVALPRLEDPPQRFGLKIIATASYEVWWDRHLIGRSGKVGHDRSTEVPGPLDNAFSIPQDLAGPGEHRVALRLSTFHKSKKPAGYLFFVAVEPMASAARAMDFDSTQRLPFLGIILLVGLFYLLVYIADDRRADTLWFSFLCLSVAAMIVAESWRDLLGYTYDKHTLRLYAVLVLTAATGFLLIGFLARRFFPREALRWSLLEIGGIAAGYAYSGTFDGRSLGIMFGTLALAAILTGRAALLRKRGSWLALGGIGLSLGLILWKRHGFMDRFFFIAFGLMLLGLMIAQALELRARARARRDALLTAARLEIELLKKNIQPHFLLNTLTSLMEWLEEAPATGARLVQALAEELRLLGEVSGRPEIPLEQELALCRCHLAVMGYRRDLRFSLETEGVVPEPTVPPAIFHTLVENGVSHHGGAPDHVFRLKMETVTEGTRYIFTAPTVRDSLPSEEGTGLRYIKARLQERYPDRWTFRHGPVPGAWQTIIEIEEA